MDNHDHAARQKEYYNAIAQEYDAHHSHHYALRYKYELCRDILNGIPLEGMNVLDALCGGGEMTGFFLENGAKVQGLDISEKCCEIYAKRFPDCPVQCVSMTKTSFGDAVFDLVFTNSLHHLPPQLDKGLDEISRILKPGGYFVCFEPLAGALPDIARKMWYRLDQKYFQENERSLDFDRLRNYLSGDFDPVKHLYGGNAAYLFVNSSMVLRMPLGFVKFYAPFCLWLERIINCIQPRFLSCWVLAVFRKK